MLCKIDKNSNYQINMKEADINKWVTLMILC